LRTIFGHFRLVNYQPDSFFAFYTGKENCLTVANDSYSVVTNSSEA